MTSIEIKNKIEVKLTLQKELLDKMANGTATEEEIKQLKDIDKEIDVLDQAYEIAVKAEKREEERKTPVNAFIPAEPKSNKSVENITRGIFGSVGGYFQAVHKSKTDTQAVENLAKLNSEVLKITNAAGMNESVPADGGVLVGTDVSTILLNKSYETGKLVSKAFKLPISQNSNSITLPVIDEVSRKNGSRYGGIQMYWEGEANQMTGTKPKMGSVELKLRNLNGLVYVTNDLLEDAAALEAWIMKKFPEEQGFKLDDAIINGTGTGMPLGIRTSGVLVKVAKETGQAAKTIIAQNVIKMFARFNGNINNALWIINGDTLPQICTMSIIIGASGVLVYNPPNGFAEAPYGTLFGIPIMPMEQCETVGTYGDIMLIDMGQYIMSDKASLKIASSMHVRFEYNEMAYRFTYRADGQPERKAPLSPFKGADTLSAFVALDNRA